MTILFDNIFINWLMQKVDYIILKERNVKNFIISTLSNSWSRNHRVVTSLSTDNVSLRWFVARIMYCLARRRRRRYNPLPACSLTARGRIRGGGENRPMGREAHPRRSQCSLLSSVCPPTSSTTGLPIVPAFSLAQVEILESVPNREQMNAFYRHYAIA